MSGLLAALELSHIIRTPSPHDQISYTRPRLIRLTKKPPNYLVGWLWIKKNHDYIVKFFNVSSRECDRFGNMVMNII